MLRSCQYCGRIHDTKVDCGKKPKKIQVRNKPVDRFRYTSAWQQKREAIKQRDNYLCQLCVRRMFDYGSRCLNTENLSVHHAIKLEENYDKRLDDSNLITLCDTHHKMADRNEIPYIVIKSVIDEQNIPPEVGT